MIFTSKLKKIVGFGSVLLLVVVLAILGTYLSNGNDWGAVIRLLTLPQCIIAYVILGAAGICYGFHMLLRQDDNNGD